MRKLLTIISGSWLALLSAGQADEDILLSPTGQELAALHCASCHQLPVPDALTKESWEFCLSYMGLFLGLDGPEATRHVPEETRNILEARQEFLATAGLLPAAPLLSPAQWSALRTHYVSQAPDEPRPPVAHPPPRIDASHFRALPHRYHQPQAVTSLVKIDEERRQLLIHDGLAERLTILDRDGDFVARHDAPGVVLVDAIFRGNDLYLLNIGDLFASRIQEGWGELSRARVTGGLIYGREELVTGLHRSTDLTLADIDADGREDALISNFGDYTGNLSLFRADPATNGFGPEPQIISTSPGIVATQVHDFDEDGRADIAALASHAQESLSILLQQPDGSFVAQTVISSPPTFGYTGLLMRDMDDDGRMDLITLNGDNGDSDPYNTLKRDHGIRIYVNRGDLQFEPSFFYPMHGVFGARIEDFDQDGDLDIAAVAFHPDFAADPRENFVYLQQTESLQFVPLSHPATLTGRWMTIDSGDLDGDGDKDIVLGAGYSPVGLRIKHRALLERMMDEGPSLLVLENRHTP